MFLPATRVPPGSLWGAVPSAVGSACIPRGGGRPPLGLRVLFPGGLRQVMGLLASVFPGRFPVTRSRQPAVLSAPLELPRSGSVRMGREGEGRKETGFRVYGLVPLGGFNRSEHRPHRLECGFCPFAIRRVRPAMPRGGATGGGRVGLQFPPLRLCPLGDGGWSIPATLCTAPLSLILGSASVCTGHSGRTPTSTPRSAQWGISPRLFTAVAGPGPR